VKILINGRYAYETALEDVEVGDEMVLPGNFSGPWTGTVTALEPEYTGRCVKAIGLSRRRAQVEVEEKALAQVRIRGWRVGEMFSKPCASCGKERQCVVAEVNSVGRPTHVESRPCGCGTQALGAYLGSAAAFRHFMIDPSL
jgi:hypothetical protein